MTILLNLLILLLFTVLMLFRVDLVPIEEIVELATPYLGIGSTVIVGCFVVKYFVYIFQMYRDIRDMHRIGGDDLSDTPSYALLGIYPVCDLIRLGVSLGLISAMLNQMAMNNIVINPFVDHVIYIVLVFVALFIDYFCKDSESLLTNLISTAVFLLPVFIMAKSLPIQGLLLLLG